MAGMEEVVLLAVGITLGFACFGFTLYALFTNPIYKVKMMRYLQPKRAWGYWLQVLPGKQIVLHSVAFANDKRAFVGKGERVVPVAEEELIYSLGRAPFQVNNDKDAKALSLETPNPANDIRDPGKLGAYVSLYEAKADAKARRKMKLDWKQLQMLLIAIALIGLVAVWYSFDTNGAVKAALGSAQSAVDNPSGLLAGVINGGGK